MTAEHNIAGFRLGIYIFEDAEIVDFSAPYGVLSVARRWDPSIDVFFVAESMRPVQAQAGFTVLPNYSFNDQPALDAFLIPGGTGTRLAGLCTGPWVYAQMGLLEGLTATARKEGDPQELSTRGMIPIDRLAALAPNAKISRARIVDAGRIITAAGISSGMELGFYLLRRAGFEESFLREVARVMEYLDAYELRKGSLEIASAIQ